jgi:hypothetical protein
VRMMIEPTKSSLGCTKHAATHFSYIPVCICSCLHLG